MLGGFAAATAEVVLSPTTALAKSTVVLTATGDAVWEIMKTCIDVTWKVGVGLFVLVLVMELFGLDHLVKAVADGVKSGFRRMSSGKEVREERRAARLYERKEFSAAAQSYHTLTQSRVAAQDLTGAIRFVKRAIQSYERAGLDDRMDDVLL